MKQRTLALAGDQNQGFEQHRRPTRRDVFLSTMEHLVPWSALCAVIEPFYPKRGQRTPTRGPGAHGAHVFRAAVVQSSRRGLRGGVARQHGVTPVCRH